VNEPETPPSGTVKTPPGEPYDPAVQAARMRALTGMTPGSRLSPRAATIGMVATALERGITWRQIGSALGYGMNPKAAKAAVKKMARAENARLYAAGSGVPGDQSPA
jgi:hypothetical protein